MTAKLRPMLALLTMIVLGWLVATHSTSTAQNRGEKMQQWQYHVETGNVFDETAAGKLGGHGWELVTVYKQNEGDFRAIYKRKS